MSAHRAADAVGLLGAAGVAALIASLAGSNKLLPLTLLLLAGELELHDILEPVPRAALLGYAAALLLLGELVSWSLSLRDVAMIDRTIVIARLRFLLATASGAVALAVAAVAASTVSVTGGLGDAAIGVGATVLLFAAISVLARPPSSRRQRLAALTIERPTEQ